MFYYENWKRFCSSLTGCDCVICTSTESLTENKRFIVLKHDVESDVQRAYKLAQIETAHGIKGSYYVQAYLLLASQENVKLLQEMQSWGHEISYHYDVLDAASGDFITAEREFEKYSNLFAEHGFKYGTICQHGNPVKERKGYNSNRDFWRNENIRKKYPQWVDMVVDYSQHMKRDYNYVSDAGYRWNIITDPETNDLHPDRENISVGGFEKLLKLIKESNNSFIVSTHPHRWMNSPFKIYGKIAIFRILRAFVMALKNVPGVKHVLNRFYYLAKKI